METHNNTNGLNNTNELNNDKLVGVFQTEQQASQAIEELKASGINKDNISVIAKDKKDLKHISEETGTKAPEGIATGAAAGGTIGGVAGLLAGIGMMAIPVFGPIMAAGPIAVTLAGAAAGAAGGGLVGGLIGLGIPEDQAKEYENNVKEGQILVLVDEQTGRQVTVYDIFRKNQASNTKYYDTDTTTATTGTGIDSVNVDPDLNDSRVGDERDPLSFPKK